MGFFSRLKSGLARTRVNLAGLFSGGVVDEEFFETLEETLIAADIGYKSTSVILQRLRDTVKLNGLKTPEQVRSALRDEIERILLPAQKPMNLDASKPLVIMMVGVNGAGKTTTIGKIAKWLAAQNKTVLLAAADTFRAAAREQLAVWGERNRIDVITQSGGDPAAVVFDAVSAGRARGTDVVIADTAGRLPTQTNLMEELALLRRLEGRLPGLLQRRRPPAPGGAEELFALVHRHPDHPVPFMLRRLEGLACQIELQQRLLHHILRVGAVFQIAVCQPEERVRVPLHRRLEFRVLQSHHTLLSGMGGSAARKGLSMGNIPQDGKISHSGKNFSKMPVGMWKTGDGSAVSFFFDVSPPCPADGTLSKLVPLARHQAASRPPPARPQPLSLSRKAAKKASGNDMKK